MLVMLTHYALAAALVAAWLALVLLPARLRTDERLVYPHIGFLARGRRGALDATVAQLRATGAVKVDERGLLVRGKRPRTKEPELARAVYDALVVPRSLRWVRVRAPVRRALARVVDEVAAAGAAPNQTRWKWARAIQLGIVVIAVNAVIRAADVPPLLLLPTVVLMAAAAAAWLVPRRTMAGYRLLRHLRHESEPAAHPSSSRRSASNRKVRS